jgi:hypothetical protein
MNAPETLIRRAPTERPLRRLTGTLAALALLLTKVSVSAGEVDTLIPDYVAKPFGAMDHQVNELAVDPQGRLNIFTGQGAYRMTEGGEGLRWSTAVGFSPVFDRDGVVYVAARALGDNILRIAMDGTFQALRDPMQESVQWTWIALTETAKMYAFGELKQPAFTQAFAQVDPLSGRWDLRQMTGVDPTQGRTVAFAAGRANRLYKVAVNNVKSVWSLYSATEDSLFTVLADLPIAMLFLAVDEKGVIYGSSNDEAVGTIWRIDPVSGISELLARGFSSVPSLAFDEKTHRLFAAEQSAPFRITAISIPPDACVPSPRATIRPSEVEIAWPTQSNRLYDVEFRSKLDETDTWTLLFTNLLGRGELLSVTDKVPAGRPERIYRVVCATNQPALRGER